MDSFKNTEHNCSSCGFRIAELALMQSQFTSSRAQHVTAGCRKAYELVVFPTGLKFVSDSSNIRPLILESKRTERHYTLSAVGRSYVPRMLSVYPAQSLALVHLPVGLSSAPLGPAALLLRSLHQDPQQTDASKATNRTLDLP
jgi:hypothetical protein